MLHDVSRTIPEPTFDDGEDVHARHPAICSGKSRGIEGDESGYWDNLFAEGSDWPNEDRFTRTPPAMSAILSGVNWSEERRAGQVRTALRLLPVG